MAYSIIAFFCCTVLSIVLRRMIHAALTKNTRTGKAVDNVNLTTGIPPKYSTIYIRWNNSSVLAPLPRSSAQKPDPNSLRGM
jgi:hypothetical protein